VPAKLAGTPPASPGPSVPPIPAESAPGRPREAVSDRVFLLGTLALAALALVLGLVRLTRNDIWFDEAASLFFARQRGLDFFRVLLREDTHGPLYYGLLKLWTWVFGEGDWVSRLPSVLCSCVCVFVVARLGARLFGRAVGLFAALLVTLSPFHLYYAQEVRFYSFIACMATLHALCFVRLVGEGAQASAVSSRSSRRASRWAWWGFAATGTACLLTFYMSGLLLVAEAVCALILRQRIERKRVLGAFATTAVLPAAWLPAVVWQIRHSHGSIRWIPQQPTWKFLTHACYTFTAGKGVTWFDSIVAVALVTGALMTLIQAVRRREYRLWPLLCWFLLPLVAVLVISLRRPLHEARYLMMILPAFFLLAVAGLGQVPWKAIRWPLAAAVIAAFVVADVRYYRQDKFGERWRDAVAYMRKEAIATETVVAMPAHEIATLTYYFPDFRHLQGANWSGNINRMLTKGHRLWILSHRDHWQMISPTLRRDAMQVDARTFGSLTLVCLLLAG